MQMILAEGFETLCVWNVDAKSLTRSGKVCSNKLIYMGLNNGPVRTPENVIVNLQHGWGETRQLLTGI